MTLEQAIRQLKADGVIRYDADIARELGVDKSYISNLLKNRAEPSKQFTKSFNEVYKLELDKIFETHTPSNAYTLSPEGKVKKQRVLDKFSQIPYYDVDFAAGNLELSEASNTKPAYMMDIPIFNGCAAFNVYSDSMESLIKAGNIMFCSKLKDWESHLEFGQIYAVSMNDNRRYLKYIKKSKDDTKFLLESANEFYEPFEIPKSKIRSIWLVEGWMAKKTQ